MTQDVLFLLILATLIIISFINIRNLHLFLIALLIITTSVYHTDLNPREVFGIHGFNTVNFLWIATFIITLFKLMVKKERFLLEKYLRFPILIFFFFFFLTCVLTVIGVKVAGVSRFSFTTVKFLKMLQYLLTGWLVFQFCRFNKSSKNIERIILLAAIVFSATVVFYFFYGFFSFGNYVAGRDMVSESVGMHANSVGALSLYFLFLSVFMKKHEWNNVRKIAIIFCFLSIIFSFSRIAYLTLLLFSPVILKKSTFKDRIILILFAAILVSASFPFIAKRVQVGVNTKDVSKTNLNKLSAGRIDSIWIPMLKEIKHPIIGHGFLYRQKLYNERKTGSAEAHNAYLKTFIDMGLLGLMSIFLMVGFLFFFGKKTKAELHYLILIMCVVSLTCHSFYPQLNNNLIWVVYGISVYNFLANTDTESLKISRKDGSSS